MAAPTTTALIDVEHDELTPVRKLAKQRLGRDMSPTTQWRVIRGKGAHGCRLEAVMIQGIWHTTDKAWGAFITGQTAAALGNDAPTTAPAERSAATQKKLAAAGLL